ncbi:mCG147159 [Mus musculus]|jgi:hypothetical protein|nr:mCG147159 [Mus musculus]
MAKSGLASENKAIVKLVGFFSSSLRPQMSSQTLDLLNIPEGKTTLWNHCVHVLR